MSVEPPPAEPAIVRWGAVAVIVRDGKLLIIKRSQHVVAPGMYCFPGGGIEAGETEQQALVRELQEELGCDVIPVRKIWESISPWRVHLAWWIAKLDYTAAITPNPLEVESAHWFSLQEMAALLDQLESNYRFLDALARGDFVLD